MPDIIHTLVLVIHIFLAVGLVGIIILMQRSEGDGLGGLGGGGGAGGMGGFLSGRSQANVITRTTAILAAGFFITSLVLAYSDHQVRTNTTLVPSSSTSAPATPGNKAPAAPSGSDSGTTGTTPAPAAPAAPAQPAAPSGQ